MTDQIKLDLGAGGIVPDGYTPMGHAFGSEIYPLAYADNSVDVIRAVHVLEHFSHRDVNDVLADWVRALKPGGVLKIAVPDFEKIAQGYLDGKGVEIPAEWLIMGGQSQADDFHRALFDREHLRQRFAQVGLVLLKPWESEIVDCAAYPISLNLQGTKPAMSEIKVSAVMSVPRLGFMTNFGSAIDGLLPLGIKLRRQGGPFWGQALTRAIETALEEDEPDAILTLDYDTVFTKGHVAHLLQLMLCHPEAGAIAPVQSSRHLPTALFTVREPGGEAIGRLPITDFDADLKEITTAHFGLTLIRADVLRTMPKPWFLPVPDEEGRWSDAGKVDEDIAFWVKLREAGHRLFLANRIAVGHIQEMIRWPGGDLQAIYQEAGDFIRTQRPPEGTWE
jgi:hypothetical protein